MEVYVVGVVVFLLGAIMASFMGVVAGRLGTGQSPLTGRSRCDACGKDLEPKALIPIVSYLLSHGRASCCSARISYWSPVSEAVLGALYVLAYLKLGLGLSLLFVFAAYALLLSLVMYDLMHQILPPELLFPFIGVAALARFLLSASLFSFVVTVFVGFALALALGIIHVLSKGRAMGLADAPFVFGLALLVGHGALTGFVYSFWVGGVVGLAILARRPRGSRMGIEVPFAPFLAAGFLLAYFLPWNLFAALVG